MAAQQSALSADPALDQVLRRVSEYVGAYGAKASLVVGTETYSQQLIVPNAAPSPPRRLVAEFALIKTGGAEGWTGYRDVAEVNGRPIRDRRDRLMKLFTEPSGTTNEVRRIADESARYNVGPISRNFNVPTTALFFFHPANISRFAFTRKGIRKIDGVSTWEIAFRETRRPTLVGTRAGKDVPAEGSIWIIPDDGTIVRTRLRLEGFADTIALGDGRMPPVGMPAAPPQSAVAPAQPPSPGGTTPSGGSTSSGSGSPGSAPSQSAPAESPSIVHDSGLRAPPVVRPDIDRISPEGVEMRRITSRADIEVTYRRDEGAAMWLPSRMSETYEGPIPRIRREPLLGTAQTIATYSGFKKFETSAKIVSPK